MSDLTALSFNPTALLMVKSEIERSIQQIEILITSMMDERKKPLGFDDDVLYLKQSGQVLFLLNQVNLAKVIDYSVVLIDRMANNLENIKPQEGFVVSHALLSAKRYIEFSCLEEKNIPQFLLSDLNALEQQLDLPQTTEAMALESILNHIPDVDFDGNVVEPSAYIHQLYKICLKQLFNHQTSALNHYALRAVGEQLVQRAQGRPSLSYWKWVYQLFANMDHVLVNTTRLRTFVNIEKNIDDFLYNPSFKASMRDVATVIYMCIAQDAGLLKGLEQQLGSSIEVTADRELVVLQGQLFAADYSTVRTVTNLLSEEITAIYQEIEVKYKTLSAERLQSIYEQVVIIIKVFSVLNMHDVVDRLTVQLPILKDVNQIHEEHLAGKVMNDLFSALNQLRLAVLQNTPKLLRYRVVNQNIAFDRLEDAYNTLINELQILVEESADSLMQYAQNKQQNTVIELPQQLKEAAGAALFVFDNKNIYQALINCSTFTKNALDGEGSLTEKDIEMLLSVYASIDIGLKDMKNDQPVIFDMFNVALNHSQLLKRAA